MLMRLARFTIAQWMICTAVVAVNAGVLRAFFVHGELYGAILIFWAIQVGFWRFLRSRGRVRRFWAGLQGAIDFARAAGGVVES
jgi:hypothetical protein